MVRETVTPNHYATLGLSPASEDVVVRAAYLALMRRYHPDRNPSAEAAARAREVAAAYAVLGDPERRAEYDYMWASGVGPMEPPPAPGRSVIPGGAFAAASLSLVLAVVFLVAWSPLRLAEPQSPRAGVQERAGGSGTAAEPMAIAALDEPPAALAAPPVAIEAAAVEPRLPPDRPAREPRVRLAQASSPPIPKAPGAAIAKSRPASVPAAARPSAPQPAVARSAAAAATPSFSCQFAKTRGEIAVCRNVNLASLDRQQALLYSQSWGRADAAKRAQLLSSRERFVAQRDSCRSDACTSSTYLARMREVSEIMTGDAKSTP